MENRGLTDPDPNPWPHTAKITSGRLEGEERSSQWPLHSFRDRDQGQRFSPETTRKDLIHTVEYPVETSVPFLPSNQTDSSSGVYAEQACRPSRLGPSSSSRNIRNKLLGVK